MSGITNLGGACPASTHQRSRPRAGRLVSGLGNIGSQLSGLFLSGSVP
ncbi:hypothetical protein BZL30_3044 [Mycobacterium kansasii]|uniref:Uncharacterized protein n=1 Tax=Mycobacterium kansasii TaxID=1768 RepID=A0A1V3XH28_MYCKA|nr:hypothetical protein BZL30_3044 [Mycobacterium kansasii]